MGHQGKQDFVSHASNNHPWALDTLRQIVDGSLDDIDFPVMSPDIKQEAEDYDIPENCLEVDMDVGTVTPSKKERKKNYNCTLCNKSFKDNYKLKRHNRVHIKAGELPDLPEPEVDIGGKNDVNHAEVLDTDSHSPNSTGFDSHQFD